MKSEQEIERKYLIRLPDPERLAAQPEYTRTEIEQIYVAAAPGTTHRARRRRGEGGTVYTETVKLRIDEMSCFEDEREITEEEYLALRARMAKGTRPIEKTRVTFRAGAQLCEVDIYPFWKRTAVLECELPSRDTPVGIPDCLTLVREVTGDFRFSNASLAKDPLPEEDL